MKNIYLFWLTFFLLFAIDWVVAIEIEVNLGRIKSIDKIWNQDTFMKLYNSTHPQLCVTNIVAGSKPQSTVVSCTINGFSAARQNGETIELFATLYSLKTNWVYATMDISYFAVANPQLGPNNIATKAIGFVDRLISSIRNNPKYLSTASLGGATVVCTVGTVRSIADYVKRLKHARYSNIAALEAGKGASPACSSVAAEVNLLNWNSSNANAGFMIDGNANSDFSNLTTVMSAFSTDDDSDDGDNSTSYYWKRFRRLKDIDISNAIMRAQGNFRSCYNSLTLNINNDRFQSLNNRVHDCRRWLERQSTDIVCGATDIRTRYWEPMATPRKFLIGAGALASGAILSSRLYGKLSPRDSSGSSPGNPGSGVRAYPAAAMRRDISSF